MKRKDYLFGPTKFMFKHPLFWCWLGAFYLLSAAGVKLHLITVCAVALVVSHLFWEAWRDQA